LGFGMLSTGVAQAAVSTYTSGATLSTTDMTVVSSTTGASMGGKFYLDLTGNGAAADDLADNDYQGLMASESITVTVTGSATGKTAVDNAAADTTDVSIQAAILATNTCSVGTETRGASAFTAVGTEGTAGSLQVPTAGTIGATDSYASNNCGPDASGGNDTDGRENRYWFSIYPNRAEAIDGGAFTVRVRVINNDPSGRAFIDKTLTVRFVSSIGNADSVLTLSASGNHYEGEGLSYATGRYVKATLTNAAGGRVVMGSATANGLDYVDPTLNAQYMTGGLVVGQALYALDTGLAGEDFIAPSTYPLFTKNKSIGDGVYGITTSDTGFTTAADIT